jgi:hypothetical protein
MNKTGNSAREDVAVPIGRMEIKLGLTLPFLFVVGALTNLALTTPNLNLQGFAEVAVHAHRRANYSQDTFELSFAPIDPEIIDELGGSAAGLPSGGSEESDTVISIPTLTPISSLPVLPTTTPTQSNNPTLPPIDLPTLPADLPDELPTLPIDLPDLELPDLPIDPPDLPSLPETVVDPVLDSIATLVPPIRLLP